MYTSQQPWSSNGKKRGRDDDDEKSPVGFSAHRDKRQLSILPIRASRTFSGFTEHQNYNYVIPEGLEAPSTLTPVNSSTESSPIKQDCEENSFFSPPVIFRSSSESFESSPPRRASSFSTASSSQDTAMYSDHEMTDGDSYNLSPGPYQPDHLEMATNLRERIPTPRHTNFFAMYEQLPPESQRRIRLPSPISEGELSPSTQLGGMADVSMQVDDTYASLEQCAALRSLYTMEEPLGDRGDLFPSPQHKKGHSRSKHSLRDWNGVGAGNLHSSSSTGKKKFSMGYRSDCQLCISGVPGHFSHLY